MGNRFDVRLRRIESEMARTAQKPARAVQDLSDAELLAIASEGLENAERLELAVAFADDVDGAARLLQVAGIEFEKAELAAIDPQRAQALLEVLAG